MHGSPYLFSCSSHPILLTYWMTLSMLSSIFIPPNYPHMTQCLLEIQIPLLSMKQYTTNSCTCTRGRKEQITSVTLSTTCAHATAGTCMHTNMRAWVKQAELIQHLDHPPLLCDPPFISSLSVL